MTQGKAGTLPAAPHDRPTGIGHDTAVQRLADQVVMRLADRLHPHPDLPSDAVTVDAFVAALLDGDDTLTLAMARAAENPRLGRKLIFFHLLSPASRRLGDMWENDEVSFLQLSMAAGRIFSILRQLRRDGAAAVQPPRPGALALFATVPGEDHTLGVTMAADLFRDIGWYVDLRCGMTQAQLLTAAGACPYTVIGLSAGHPASVPSLIRLTAALRASAPAARIILSGHLLDLMPSVGALCGADAAMTDFDSLQAVAETYLPA